MGVPASAGWAVRLAVRWAVIGRLLGLMSLSASCEPPKLMTIAPAGPPAGTRPDDPSSAGAGGEGGGEPGPVGGSAPGIDLPDAAAADDSGGAGPTCAGESHVAKLVPVDLFLLVDVSGSMLSLVGGTTSKWDLVRSALMTFFADPKSAGLGVGLQFFPLPAPCTQASDCTPFPIPGVALCRDHGVCSAPGMSLAVAVACDSLTGRCPAGTTCTPVLRCSKSRLPCLGAGTPCPGGAPDDLCDDPGLRCLPALADGCQAALYAQPVLPVGELPGWQNHLQLAIGSVNPGGSTPMAPAVAATLPVVRMHAALHPDRKAIMVLATDGFPTGCGPNTIDTVAAALAQGRMGLPATPTYVIGVFAQTELVRSNLALSQLALAGGTVVPFVLEEGKDLAQKFLAALEQIRGSALACEFAIPKPTAGNGTLDFGKVNVRFTPGSVPGAPAAAPEDLLYVAAADRCDPARGGWHYDVDPKTGATPSRIRVCDASCKRFRSETAGKVELQVGCTSRVD